VNSDLCNQNCPSSEHPFPFTKHGQTPVHPERPRLGVRRSPCLYSPPLCGWVYGGVQAWWSGVPQSESYQGPVVVDARAPVWISQVGALALYGCRGRPELCTRTPRTAGASASADVVEAYAAPVVTRSAANDSATYAANLGGMLIKTIRASSSYSTPCNIADTPTDLLHHAG